DPLVTGVQTCALPISKGLWTIPSGYVEPRESVVQTIEREVTEETGIAGRAGPILGVRNQVTETANDTFLIFSMTYVSGEPRPDQIGRASCRERGVVAG